MAEIIDLSLEREKRKAMPKIILTDSPWPKATPVQILDQMMMEIYNLSGLKEDQ